MKVQLQIFQKVKLSENWAECHVRGSGIRDDYRPISHLKQSSLLLSASERCPALKA